jgi:hypothetical protein
MYLDAQQLDMLPKHYKALEKGKTITLPFKSLGVGRDVMLSKEQAKKIAKAITKGSGVRLSMTPDQVELHRGAGLWEEMKELIKENKKFIIEKGVPAFTAAVAVATAANPVVSTAFLAMTPGMQMAVEDIINQYIEDKDPSTLKQRLQILKKYLTAKQIKELATMIMGVGSVAGAGIADQRFSINDVIKTLSGKGTPIGDQKFSINEAVGEVKRVFRGKGKLVGGQKGIRPPPPMATMGSGKGRGRPRTRGMPLVGQTQDMVLTQKGEIDPTISSRDSAIEYEGGDLFDDIGKAFKKVGSDIKKKVIEPADKAFKKVGKTINKEVIKPAGKYITAKKGGLASDLIDYGIPAATGAIVGGITGLATGGVGGVVGSAAGSKLGKEIIAPAVRKATGAGMMRGAGHCGMPAGMCGCGVGGALMPAGYDGEGLMPAGMGLMPAGMGLKPAGSGVYMPAGRTIVRHGKGVRARVMVPKKMTVDGGAMMPKTSSAGTGDYIPLGLLSHSAFYTPLMK